MIGGLIMQPKNSTRFDFENTLLSHVEHIVQVCETKFSGVFMQRRGIFLHPNPKIRRRKITMEATLSSYRILYWPSGYRHDIR
jgi:hypothetical protein